MNVFDVPEEGFASYVCCQESVSSYTERNDWERMEPVSWSQSKLFVQSRVTSCPSSSMPPYAASGVGPYGNSLTDQLVLSAHVSLSTGRKDWYTIWHHDHHLTEGTPRQGSIFME